MPVDPQNDEINPLESSPEVPHFAETTLRLRPHRLDGEDWIIDDDDDVFMSLSQARDMQAATSHVQTAEEEETAITKRKQKPLTETVVEYYNLTRLCV